MGIYFRSSSYLADNNIDLFLGSLDALDITLDVDVHLLLLGIQVIFVGISGLKCRLLLLTAGNIDPDSGLGLNGLQSATLDSQKMGTSGRWGQDT